MATSLPSATWSTLTKSERIFFDGAVSIERPRIFIISYPADFVNRQFE